MKNGGVLPETAVSPPLAEVLGVSIGFPIGAQEADHTEQVYSDGEQHFNVSST